ncbi:MAG: hypothetical protein QM534_05485 [Sediminibacterium sp.]|nr:hypothetical protein [Sediminibacterium sp.]
MKIVFRKFLLGVIFGLFFSCIDKRVKEERNRMNSEDSNFVVKTNTRRDLDCLPKMDTVFNGNAIKYLVKDSCIRVRVSFKNGNDTLLSDCYDCQAATSFIPKLYKYSEDAIFLLMGHGFDYREFIMIQQSNNKIQIKNYETALNVDLERNVLVYRSYEHGRELHFVYFKKNKEKIILLPESYENGRVINSWFEGKSFYIETSDDNKRTKVENFEIK